MHNQQGCDLAGYGQEYEQNDALSDTHAIFKHFSSPYDTLGNSRSLPYVCGRAKQEHAHPNMPCHRRTRTSSRHINISKHSVFFLVTAVYEWRVQNPGA
jgi:hypothetical protein